MAVFSCCEEMLRTLLDHLSPELRQTESNNALQVACAEGLHTTVKWLLSNTEAQPNLVSQMTGKSAVVVQEVSSFSLQCGEDEE